MKTSSGLVNYAKDQVGLPYWYGTYGQTSTEALYNYKKMQYPNQYIASDFKKQYGLRVHDCVGLIKGYLWSDSSTSRPKYDAETDVSANGMFCASKERGDMSTFKKINGLLVYKGSNKRKNHVGIYSDGYVYEAKGHRYGVVKSVFNNTWKFWSKCPFIEYNDVEIEKTKSNLDIAYEVIRGLWGNGVTRRKRLKEAGYNYREIQKIVNSLLRG